MHMKIAFPLAAAILLAGCGSDNGPKTPDQAAKEAAKMERPQPGMYRSTVNVLEFDIPGLPPQEAEQMKQMMGRQKTQSHEFCLKAEDVEKGFEQMIKKSADGNCTFERFNASANTIDAKMTCDMGEAGQSVMSMTGTTSSTKSRMVMDIDHENPSIPGGTMHTKMEVTNERIGDCT